jgi:predicted dehydrogenase
VSARAAADQIDGSVAGTPEAALASNAGLLVVATRHASHAALAVRGLRAGKAVFVEKPPCLTWDELEELRTARSETGCQLAVGFNRRHAPLAVRLREHVAAGDHPLQIVIRVNAGRLPDGHWANDLEEGGGRLLGEGCHFVDLACWLAGATPATVRAVIQPIGGEMFQAAQRFTVSLGFANGSLATILYTDQGASGLAKEYVEAHAGGRSAVLHDFRRLELVDGRSRRELQDRHGDKGHRRQFTDLRRRLGDGTVEERPDPLSSMAVTLAALDAGMGGGELTLDSFPI